MIDGYRTALICSKCGRVITPNLEDEPDRAAKYCTACGGEVISQCPECQAKIRGSYIITGLGGKHERLDEAPRFCHNCGKPYPWNVTASPF